MYKMSPYNYLCRLWKETQSLSPFIRSCVLSLCRVFSPVNLPQLIQVKCLIGFKIAITFHSMLCCPIRKNTHRAVKYLISTHSNYSYERMSYVSQITSCLVYCHKDSAITCPIICFLFNYLYSVLANYGLFVHNM